MASQELASSAFGTDLTVTWKIHIIFNNIVPFCKIQECGLGRFAEQAGIELVKKKNIVIYHNFLAFVYKNTFMSDILNYL